MFWLGIFVLGWVLFGWFCLGFFWNKKEHCVYLTSLSYILSLIVFYLNAVNLKNSEVGKMLKMEERCQGFWKGNYKVSERIFLFGYCMKVKPPLLGTDKYI